MARITKERQRKLTALRERIESARQFRKDEGLDDLWERLIDLYAGQHYPKGLQAEDRIAVNVAFSTINVISPSVSVNNPKIVVAARTPEQEMQALIVEQVVNYWWKHFDVHSEFRRAVDDFLMVGFGWLKTGYRFVEEEVDDPDGYAEELEAANQDADDYAAANPHLAGGLPTPEEIAANIPTTRLQTVEDRPFAERISPFDVFVDPEATSLRDARWIAQRVVRSLHEVHMDESYNASARKAVVPDERVRDSVKPETVKRRDPNWQRVTVWEMYDLISGEMCVFSQEGDGYLVAPTQQPYAFGHPFVMLRNYNVPDRFYPMGELEAIEPLVHELNATRTAQMNDRKQKQRAWIYRDSAFDKNGKKLLASSADNRMIPVIGNENLSDVVQAMPSQQLDVQMYQYSDLIEQDINEITGLSEYARGALPETRRTATEAAIIQDASNARAADKLGKIETIIGEVARRLIQLAQQYMTEEQVVRVVGRNNAPLWIPVDPSDIQGEYDFEVEGGSTQPMNEQGRRQQAVQMLNALGPMLVPGGPLNTPELLKHILKDGFGIKDASRYIAAPPDPRQGMGAPPPLEGAPDGGMPPVAPPPGGPPMQAPMNEPPPDIPPELLAQLQGQVGLPA